MHASKVLQKLLDLDTPMHRRRQHALIDAVLAVFRAPFTSLTRLGYALARPIGTKHRIKCLDRLLGNRHLHHERVGVYRRMARFLLRGNLKPVITVDWSPLCPDQRWQLLRASLPIKGRSLTLYEEVHPQSVVGSRRVQQAFLTQLASLLDTRCRPIVVTDAGFKAPWFKAVEAQGWHWLGRLRGQVLLTRPGEDRWLAVRLLYALAETKPRSLGSFLVARANPIMATAVVYRHRLQGRHSMTLHGRPARSKADRQCARRTREPWLLIASLGLSKWPASRLEKLYRQRDLSPVISTTHRMRFSDNRQMRRSHHEETLHRRTDHQSHQAT